MVHVDIFYNLKWSTSRAGVLKKIMKVANPVLIGLILLSGQECAQSVINNMTSMATSALGFSSATPSKFKYDDLIKMSLSATDYRTEEFYNQVNLIEIPTAPAPVAGASMAASVAHLKKGSLLLKLSTRTLQFDLAEIMFKAAVETFDMPRMQALLDANMDVLLSDEQKVEILKAAFENLSQSASENPIYGILKALLENDFYITKEELAEDGVVVHNWTCPLFPVLQDPFATAIFQEYEKDVFFNDKKCNYVSQALETMDLDVAKRALDVSCNPRVRKGGRNALDEILTRNECEIYIQKEIAAKVPGYESKEEYKICMEQEGKRILLIGRLKSEFGVKISASLNNFQKFCSQGKLTLADDILTTASANSALGKENFDAPETSLAVLESAYLTKNAELIKKAVEVCFNNLNFKQMKQSYTAYLTANRSNLDKDIMETFTKNISAQELINKSSAPKRVKASVPAAGPGLFCMPSGRK